MKGPTNTNAAPSTKRRLAIICMASLVALSGCGVRSGMEKVDDAKQVKKQAEDVQHKLRKDLNKGRDY